MHKAIAVIPARFHSKRLPGKPLILIGGVPLIIRVINSVRESKLVSDVIVATDSEKIADVVRSYGEKVVITSADHQTGSDRVAEVLSKIEGYDIVVNIQGDEPFISGDVVDKIINCFDDPNVIMSTVCTPIRSDDEANDPNNVKVVLDSKGFALYFSRSRIPYHRTQSDEFFEPYHHIGVYGFRREFLEKFARLERTPLEIVESLEQLRALEHGYKIKTIVVDHVFIGIDSEDDINKAEEYLKGKDQSNG